MTSEIQETSVTIRVDGQEVSAVAGQLLIDACSDAGVYIPHFCYHPRMSPVGMCRMCLVEVDTGRGLALMTSCTLSVAQDMEVITESDTVKKAQNGVLEFLLINHPLDCPVCDKGGECPLQDQTVAFGPGESRFVEDKRHFVKPIPISSQIFLDRERCILCDRCTRFADEVAGEALISFQGRGQHTEVNTFPEADFENYFSGNTVQICPVGALTAKPYRFKARPWDLLEIPSTYPNPMGDRIVLQASNNQLVRILGMDSDAVNWGWLTDKDRFGFQAVSSPNRLTQPMIRKAGGLVEVSWHEALNTAASLISSAWSEIGASNIAILGGADLPTEDQYVWTRLAKGVICTDNVDALVGESLPGELLAGIPRTSLDEALQPGSLVVVLGSDIKEELGTLYLRLRHALINDGVELIELTTGETSLTQLAKHSIRVFPGEINQAVQNISKPKGRAKKGETADIAAAISKAVKEKKLTVIFSVSSLSESPSLVAAAAYSFIETYGESVRLIPLLRKGNSFGAIDMGLIPGILPGRNSMADGEKECLQAWGKVQNEKGLNAPAILKAASRGNISTLILLGEDPLGDFPDGGLVWNVLNSRNKPKVISVDKFMTPTISNYADVVLPVATLGEREGSHTNLEGRISPLNKIISPTSPVRCEWEIAQELSRHLGVDMDFESLSDIWEEIQSVSSLHSGVNFLDIQNSEDGILLEPKAQQMEKFQDSILFEKDLAQVGIAKDSYSHRLVVKRPMYDGSVWQVNCESFEPYFADSSVIKLHPEELMRLGIQSGSSVEVSHMGEKKNIKPLILIAQEDASLSTGIAVMDFSPPTLNIDSAKAHSSMLVDSELTVNDVMIQKITSSDIFSR